MRTAPHLTVFLTCTMTCHIIQEMNLVTICMHMPDVWNCVIDPEGRKCKRVIMSPASKRAQVGIHLKSQGSCRLKPQFRNFFLRVHFG